MRQPLLHTKKTSAFAEVLGNDSKTNTMGGYRFAITLSFCNGCIWVQKRFCRVQIEAWWVQHRGIVLLLDAVLFLKKSQFVVCQFPA